MKTLRHRLLFAALILLVGVSAVVQPGSVSAAAALRSSVSVIVKSDLTNDVGLATASAPVVLQRILDLPDGNGAGQARVLWTGRRTIAASTTEDIDLNGGGLTDPFGTAFAPAKIRAIVISASAGNTNNVIVGGDANNTPFLQPTCTGSACAGFATVTVQPGGMFLLTAPSSAGIAVTAGTGDIIQVANSGSGTSVTYDIVVIGTSS